MARIEPWRWRVPRSPEVTAALDRRWYEQLAKHRHQPYPRRGIATQDTALTVTVHADSLGLATAEALRSIQILLSFPPEQIDAVCTPTMAGEPQLEIPSRLDSIRYGDVVDGPAGQAVKVELTRTDGRSTLTTMPLVEAEYFLLRRALATLATEGEREVLRAAWKDMEAHKALKRHIFLTAHPSVLRYRQAVGSCLRVWVLTAEEALDYFEMIAKGEGRYPLKSVATTDRWTYYEERINEMVPSLSRAWGTVTHWQGNDREDVLRYLLSLRTRLTYLMEARDHIGYLYYTSADLDANDASLYHLNYFFLLAAAAFDNVAWVLQHVYNLALPRGQVGLHPKQELRKHVSQPFKAVCDSHDKLLRVFQEPRHSVAHRLVMRGIGFRDRDTGGGSNLVEIDDDLAAAIEGVDSGLPDGPYSDWGVARIGPAALLEPYRFTTAALIEILDFAEEFLSLLLADSTLGWRLPTEPEESREPRWGFAIPYFRPIV